MRVSPDFDAYGTDADTTEGAHPGAPLPEIVQWFKTMTTNGYIRGVKTNDWPEFSGRVWQRNYYEHIIRDEISLQRIREYFLDNPSQRVMDVENPTAPSHLPTTKEMWEE